MRVQNNILTLLILIMLIPGVAAGQQVGSDYCSAPPYVSRSNAPNLMILMDNSSDMMNPAYPGTYDPTTLGTQNEYIGYFNPSGCYYYNGNNFVEVLKTVVGQTGSANFGVSYTASDSCPTSTDPWGQPAAPFRGNLLNWATMSKYDVVQQILVGGNATAKEPGKAFYTLKGIEGSWPTRTYKGCAFTTNSGNLTIADAVMPGDCSLLDSPTPTPIAFWRFEWIRNLFMWFSQELHQIYASVSHGLQNMQVSLADVWENTRIFVKEAWGAPCSISVSSSSSTNGTVGIPYSITFTATGKNNSTFTWSAAGIPSWMTGPALSNSGLLGRVNDVATWSGTPPAAGFSIINVTASTSGCTNGSLSETISITAAPLLIVTTGLQSGNVGASYSFAMTGQGGTAPWAWSASGLPSGLSICKGPSDATWNSASSACKEAVSGNLHGSGVIYGTPTASGSFNVTVTLSDSGSPAQTISKSYTLTIASSSLSITTAALPAGTVGTAYSYTMSGAGGTTPYTWSATGLDPGLTMNSSGAISGIPFGPAGTDTVIVTLKDASGTTVTNTFSLLISAVAGPLTITSACPVDAVVKQSYSYTMTGSGGTKPYTWGGTVLPSWLTLNTSTGVLSGIAPNTTETDTIIFTLKDSANNVATETCTLHVVKSLSIRSQQFNIWMQLNEEPIIDTNGNNIFDPNVPGECFYDYVTNPNPTCATTGVWQGKQGIFQQFWDQDHPRARWGLTIFGQSGNTTNINTGPCIPASPAASFFTAIQNATPANYSPLAAGLYGDINYYAFNQTGYKGCTSSNPIDSVTCRKNFVLVLSSGTDVSSVINHSTGATSGPFPSGTAGCANSSELVQNACVGFKSSKSTDAIPQVYTYFVNTMGATNNATLQQAAAAGGGKYYDATDYSSLKKQLIQAIQDILARAASGTAVSVLTTSSRGVGSVVQAYFLPSLQVGTRNVVWTGYMQNMWVDPQDNLREDTVKDYKLLLDQDDVVRLYFNETSNQTEAGLFTTTADGTGGTLASCQTTTQEPFSDVKALFEAGQTLALTRPSDRTIFTSTKVIRGNTTTNTFSLNNFSWPLSDPAMTAALNPDATYTASKIVSYLRGECEETGMTGDQPCGSTVDTNFRDRRVSLSNGDANGNVWKLGDIISSTPKVLGNTPLNTYQTQYSDGTYLSYVSSPAYQQRPSVSIVGANDGMVHAFRVGFLKDTGLIGMIKALFQNSASDAGTNKLGNEEWAYIPFNAFPYLKYLADPTYCHIYYNDLSIRLVDVSTGGNPTSPKPADGSSWRTIAIGGMRFGGSCAGGYPNGPPTGTPANVGFSAYFALDVTDPLSPIPLWEFSEPNLGYTTSYPAVLRTGAAGDNGNWYVAFGSGSTTLPGSMTDINRSTIGYVYILDLMKGTMLQKISLGNNAIVGDILSADANNDYNSEKMYFGTSVWNGATHAWNGQIIGIPIPINQDLATWTPPTPTVMFRGAYPFTASPDATKDAAGHVWIYAGSGKYYSEVDETDTSQQIFLGFIDDTSIISYPINEGSTTPAACPGICPNGSLCDVTNCTTSGTVGSTIQMCEYNPTTNTFGFQPVVTTIASSGSQPQSTIGWKIYFNDNERIISRPLAVGGLVDFLPYIPSGDPCKYGGNSFLYSVNYTTGLAPSNIAIRSPYATSGTSGSVTVNRGVLLGPGAPPTGEAIIIAPQKSTPGSQDQLKKKIQLATGVIVEAVNKPLISTSPKFMQWLKK